jgi:hypothetical protein
MTRWFLDKDGNFIKQPKDLMEKLKDDSPILANKLNSIIEWKQNLSIYKNFLYNFPSEEELKLDEKPNWESYIKLVDSQEGLEKIVHSIDGLKRSKRDLTGDKVVVIQSDRPLYDSLNSEKRIGKAQGWIGEIESYDITTIEGAKFYSFDEKIHQRIILKNATPLSEDILKTWLST